MFCASNPGGSVAGNWELLPDRRSSNLRHPLPLKISGREILESLLPNFIRGKDRMYTG